MAVMTYLRKMAMRLWKAHLNFQEHEGTLAAAGIGYYVALSFFPLLLVLVAGLSAVLEWTQFGQNAFQALRTAISQQASPDLAQQVDRTLKVVSARAPAGGPIGFVVLIISAIAIFAQLDAAFDRIFRLPHDPHASWMSWIKRLLFQRLKALGMLAAVGGFIIMVMITSMVWAALQHSLEPRVQMGPWGEWLSNLWINLGLNLFAFTMIYRAVPRPSIRWRDAVHGGFLTAVLWEAGRQALAAYLIHLNYPNEYGIIGSFIAVMLWSYYASMVILFGAEYLRVLREEHEEQLELPLKNG
jgi:membrane protein